MKRLNVSLELFALSLVAVVASVFALGDFPQDRHTSENSEWFFQETAINDALQGKRIKRIWATGLKLVIVTEDAQFEYIPEITGKVELLPRGRLIRPSEDSSALGR